MEGPADGHLDASRDDAPAFDTGPASPPAGAPPDVRASRPTAPVGETQRIVSIDVLRGVALLGILVMNIQGFAWISAAYMNPTAYGDLEGANRVVWYLSHLLADQKFMTIFSMLFGAGVVLMSERAEASGRGSASVHYRRMGWLLAIGLVHGYAFWYGDILYSYAMCGFLVWLFRRLPPWVLIPLGIASIAVSSLLSVASGWSMQIWLPEQIEEFGHDWNPGPEVVDRELAAYRGNWLAQAVFRAPVVLEFQTLIFAFFIVWRVTGCMLLGMALYKLRVFAAERSSATYVTMMIVGFGLGVPIIMFGVAQNVAHDWSIDYSFFFGPQYNYWASLLVALGWIGLVMLVCRSPLAGALWPLAAVGRMALSNYLLHTIVFTAIFYGHGLGLFGSVERTGQIAMVGGMCVAQLIGSPIWLHYFRFGPFEWLWRSLTYWRVQPFRRSRAVV